MKYLLEQAMMFSILCGVALGAGLIVVFLALVAFESPVGFLIGIIIVMFAWPVAIKSNQYRDEALKLFCGGNG